MRRINLKIGIGILIFALIVTIAFALVIFWFQKTSLSRLEADNVNGHYYQAIDNFTFNELIASGEYTVDVNKVLSTNNLNTYYYNQIFSHIIPISSLFAIFLIAASVIFWFALSKIQMNESVRVAKTLDSITEKTDSLTMDPLLEASYQKIKARFDNNLNDYKRLNSYLSHEQKNAIAILRTNLELSENTTYIKSLDYIADSIDDILTLSESDDMAVRSEVDVALVCAEACDNYSKLSSNIQFDFDENEHTIIYAKERWILRAVSNLLNNAIKYGEGNPIKVSVTNKHHSVIISVSDNGVGIKETMLDKIFNNWYRINELNKDGYGIGLSLVSHVCDLCEGFAWVESKENKGSQFYLSFPAGKIGMIE